MGRRLFDVIDGPRGWSDSIGYGADRNAQPPVFVLTHQPPHTWRLGERFSFVTEGPHRALERARAAAGEKDVVVMGGGAVCHEVLAAGLADILNIHLARSSSAAVRDCSRLRTHHVFGCNRSAS
ncbi:hypothetical protein [Actinocrinis sp.]|uniref:hypothetical protein n=1 Tax=Actinocrinis sp. TaxID=1920516 RepID=UPI002CE5040B|nr:hypothetical protein [Actinocrinis sp.]HXR74120.1 hypothetical protein [Actinocrinis sp.]